jgi:hypothetical protein
MRCASATKIVRPQESTAETQPQLQPALLRIFALAHTRKNAKFPVCGPRTTTTGVADCVCDEAGNVATLRQKLQAAA